MFRRMIGRFLAVAFLALTLFAQPANAQSQQADMVVELYTSQGCSQCPRANRLLGMFGHEERTLPLTFPVGIWDYLGWHDTFAQPEFAERQRALSRRLRVRGRFTPQLVINGATQVSASDWDEARATFERERTRTLTPINVRITRPHSGLSRVTLGSGAPRAPADIWMIAYDPGPVAVYITSGVNMNRRIYHYNLVRSIEQVGTWNGGAAYFERSRCAPECAVLIQEQNGGPLIAAAFTSRR